MNNLKTKKKPNPVPKITITTDGYSMTLFNIRFVILMHHLCFGIRRGLQYMYVEMQRTWRMMYIKSWPRSLWSRGRELRRRLISTSGQWRHRAAIRRMCGWCDPWVPVYRTGGQLSAGICAIVLGDGHTSKKLSVILVFHSESVIFHSSHNFFFNLY